jgi:hypothetical protein
MTATVTTSDDVDDVGLDPDARALRRDLRGAAFMFGVDAGWWREVDWSFPNVDIAIAAAPRAGAPAEFLFRFECTQYPMQAPLGLVWDAATNQPAAQPLRPIGEGQVKLVFRTDWMRSTCTLHSTGMPWVNTRNG